MINLDMLVQEAGAAKLEAEICLLRAGVARRKGNTWLADMLEMDAKFAAEEAAVLLGKIMIVGFRKDEIAQVERDTGVEFDARHMDVLDFDRPCAPQPVTHERN
jgi:hypothetical protein